ncbi:MAG: thioredoxin fold domain-containing protein [Xanthomonadales bacterium]|nr:thioredoxin fold domain-containing protein [Xanthomonadales bacterium]
MKLVALAVGVVGLLFFSSLLAIEREDMQVTDLSADAHTLLEGDRIMLLIITRSTCPYCNSLMKTVMLPLAKSGVWDSRVVLRELELDVSPEILDFSGKPVDATAFAERYGHPFTPTILFLDRCGREVGLRHNGYDGSDFFEFYLDKSIKQAREWLVAHPPECIQ